MKQVVEITSVGITIRNTIQSTSGSIIDYEENQTKVATHDEKNLVFPLLSKTTIFQRFKCWIFKIESKMCFNDS